MQLAMSPDQGPDPGITGCERDAPRGNVIPTPPRHQPPGRTMTTEATDVSVGREPELLGQTVVLIGGSAGIGLETARRARAEGADVVLTGRDPERLERAARDVDARSTAAFDARDAAALQRSSTARPTRSTMCWSRAQVRRTCPARDGRRSGARGARRHVVLGLEDGKGLLRDGRLYQLVREHDGVRERTLEIAFREPGAEAYVFTFG